MKKTINPIVCVYLLLLCLFNLQARGDDVATVHSRKGIPYLGAYTHRLEHANSTALAAQEYRGIGNLDESLSERWTREKYISAYRKAFDRDAWQALLDKQKRRQAPIGRFPWAELEPVARLYEVTGDDEYLNIVRAFLLHEVEYPSGDRQFALSRIALCYKLVRPGLSNEDRETVDASIALHADKCVTMESGTEMNRGMVNTLGLLRVAKMLPDHPHQPRWEDAHRRNWEKGVLRTRDNNEDSISYNHLWLYNLMQYVEAAGIDQKSFYAQPWVRDIFQRHLNVRDPIGNEPRTRGPNPDAGAAVAAMEWAGSIYGDGRYRWAAQRMLNFLRSQPGLERWMPREPVFVHVDDSVPPVQPSGGSYYSHRRYDREFPNKFVLRNGYGPDATALFVNLFNGGGHGAADGSAIYGMIDQYGILLDGTDRYAPEEQYSNLLLIRGIDDDFPFGTTWKPERWRRTRVNLHAGNTATGGPDINLEQVTGLGLRLDGTPKGTITIKDIFLENAATRKTIRSEAVSTPATKWVTLPLEYPLNLSDWNGLSFTWKYNLREPLTDVAVFANSNEPRATSRWHRFLMDTWRDSRVRFFGDFAKVHMTSIEVDVHDYLGGDHTQYRDIIMLPNKVAWVRDTLVFGGAAEKELQVGPLWHLRSVTAKGGDWFQTNTHSTNYDKHRNQWVQAGRPRGLLIILPERKEIQTGHVLDLDDLSGRPHCVFQKWQGAAQKGKQTAFNSLLVPNDGQIDPAELRKRITVLHEDDSIAVIRVENWLLLDNPDGRMIEAAGLQTDYSLSGVWFFWS